MIGHTITDKQTTRDYNFINIKSSSMIYEAD